MIFEAAKRIRASPVRAWGLAAFAFGAALWIRFASDHVLPAGFPYLTFFPAVILTSFFAGLAPGLVCGLLGGVAAWYWFIPPFGAFAISPSVLIALAFYAFIVGIDILLIQVMHRAVEGLEAEREINQELLRRQRALLGEQEVRQRQQLLLQRELSHRMKNTLAMVQAVVSQSLRNATDPKAAAAMASARIQALARAQDTLTASDWSAADVGAIVAASIEPHADGAGRFRMSGPPIELEARHAMGLALAIHELGTNATKYGALSTPDGVVDISWAAAEGDRFTFLWQERHGPPVAEPKRRGFGSRLTEQVVPGYFGGTASIAFAPDGLVYRLDGALVPEHGEDS